MSGIFLEKKSGERTISRKMTSMRTRQKSKRGDRKEESNDSPKIPDKGVTSDIPGLPSADSKWIHEHT